MSIRADIVFVADVVAVNLYERGVCPPFTPSPLQYGYALPSQAISPHHRALKVLSHCRPPIEARFYYAGLPSAPVLVARTGITPWN